MHGSRPDLGDSLPTHDPESAQGCHPITADAYRWGTWAARLNARTGAEERHAGACLAVKWTERDLQRELENCTRSHQPVSLVAIKTSLKVETAAVVGSD